MSRCSRSPGWRYPVDADVVNTRAAILERARRCAKARGRVPNLIAVDFAERGDLVGAAAELNDEFDPDAPAAP